MAHSDAYTIVFQKLEEARSDQEAAHTSEQAEGVQQCAEASPKEIDEIAEMRRLAMEIAEPDRISFTTT